MMVAAEADNLHLPSLAQQDGFHGCPGGTLDSARTPPTPTSTLNRLIGDGP
jgi:hypothetical protein